MTILIYILMFRIDAKLQQRQIQANEVGEKHPEPKDLFIKPKAKDE